MGNAGYTLELAEEAARGPDFVQAPRVGCGPCLRGESGNDVLELPTPLIRGPRLNVMVPAEAPLAPPSNCRRFAVRRHVRVYPLDFTMKQQHQGLIGKRTY